MMKEDKASGMGWGFWIGGVTGLTLSVAFYMISGALFSFIMLPLGIAMGVAQGYMMPAREKKD